MCRHEYVLAATNLFTHESFVYYKLLLDQLLDIYDVGAGRKLHCLFLDIMCHFAPYWHRWVPHHQQF